jgi:hypothetical protein
LVERSLCRPGEFLEIYGSGSDYEAAIHSRVFFHSAPPTHRIVCTTINDEPARDLLSERGVIPSQCSFDGFATPSGEWFEAVPPFDHVVLELGDEVYVVPVSAVTFELNRLAISTDPLSQTGGATPRR